MNLLTLLYFFCLIAYLYFGFYLFYLAPNKTLNKVALALYISLSIWSFSFIFMHSAPDKETAVFWLRISSLGWSSLFSIMLHFFMLLGNIEKPLQKKWLYPLIYLPAIIFIYHFFFQDYLNTNLIIDTPLGWSYSIEWPYSLFLGLYYLGYSLLCLLVGIIWWKKSQFKREKKQIKLILGTTMLAIGLGTITGFVLPILEIGIIPPVGIIINLISMGAIWYAIKRYRFQAFSPQNITDAILETMSEGLLFLDLKGKIKMINQSTKKLLDYKTGELIDKPVEMLFLNQNNNNQPWISQLTDCSQNREHVIKDKETALLTKEQDKIPVSFSASLAYDELGDPLGVVCSFQDITNRIRDRENLKKLTFYDRVTYLYNRTYLEKELEKINLSNQTSTGIIMADLNGLKLINDGFGHETGDKILKKAADILKNSCRKEDVVGRWGGDEFIIIINDANINTLERIISDIKQACRQEPEDPVAISLATGSAIKKEADKNIYEVLKEAEDNMYKNKLIETKSIQYTVLDTLLNTLGTKSYETEQHVHRLQNMSYLLGKKIGLSQPELENLVLLASLHDIGNVSIPEDILVKPEKLSEKDWEVVKKHPEIGYRMASATQEFAHIAEFILHHHEWWDGSGYPKGISGENIPLLSRIIAIVDAYDVMITERPYKKAITQKEAKEELKRCAGTQLDPELTSHFIELIEEGKIDKVN